MKALVTECIAEITHDAGARKLDPADVRLALIVRLRDQHACTLEQIAETLGISPERVRQLYRRERQPRARSGRAPRAPVEELSARAIAALRDAGLEPDASLRDIALLMPLLRLVAKRPGDPGFNADFHLSHFDRTALREIEEWLRRHGVVVRR